MSIYRPRFKRLVSDNDVTHTVTRSPAPSESTVGTEVAPELARLRKARPINHLLPMSVKWLRSLPEQVRPVALASQYPRIANLLALDWKKPEACSRYLDDLLVDRRRGNRNGFPLDVHQELETLRDYCERHRPQARTNDSV